ncbi:MAG: EAL domain-containing protein [Pseudomonadota bacterium]
MQVVTRALQRLREHLGLDIAYIGELEGNELIVRAVCAPDLDMDLPEPLILPRDHSFCHFMQSGQIPQIVHDSATNPITVDLPSRHAFNIQSYIGVPLQREDGSNYGTICCIGHEANTSLNERDLRSIKLFAEIIIGQIDGELEDRRVAEERFNRIRSTIDTRAFSMRFQPLVSLHGDGIKGFEALCRFDETPYRTPDLWFGEAALAGLGVEMELVAVKDALRALNVIPSHQSITLNVSPDCLMSEGLSDVLFDVQAERVILEITEHAEVANYAGLSKHIERYKSQGVSLAVDDAGAGYSSLSHIVRLKPDIIKLDMSLTRDVDKDPIRQALASALVFFATGAKADIVAEGIETAGEARTLTDLGVTYGQGFHFSKPLTLEDTVAFSERYELKRSSGF